MGKYCRLVIVLLFLQTAHTQLPVEKNACTTHDNATGTCINIYDCPDIINQLKSLKPPITDEQREVFRKYKCGSDESTVNVCCRKNPNPAINVTTRGKESTTIKPTQCRTPDNKMGTCIKINSCSPMIDYLSSIKSPITDEQRRFLLSYRCEGAGSDVNVCCPAGPLVSETRPTQKPNVSSKRVDITKHPNMNLIPHNTCGLLQNDDKIINGLATAIFDFPWMALISFRRGNTLGFECGGTLINNRYVLTAAHCITSLKAPLQLAGVRLGEHDLGKERDCETYPGGEPICTDPVQDVQIEEVIPHPEYLRSTLEHDIGLLRLARPVNTSTESVRPLCLPLYEEVRNVTLESAIVTGWGFTETNRKSNVLLKAKLPIYDHDRCKQIYSPHKVIGPQQICAGGGRSDSCQSDSGGPLQALRQLKGEIRYVQYGIVSFGWTPCGLNNNPGVYTKVTSYLEWILDNMKE